MNPGPRAVRLLRRSAFWIAAGFALLVAHDAVFLAQVGPGEALTRTLRGAAHEYWGTASGLLMSGAAAATLIWAARIALLRRQPKARPPEASASRTFARRATAHWVRLLVVVALAFAVQENAEHLLSHGHLIGTGALLGPEYPLSLPVLALVTGLAAAVTALVREHEAELLRQIGVARAAIRRAQRRIGPSRPRRSRVGSTAPMSTHRALRAPPRAFLHA